MTEKKKRKKGFLFTFILAILVIFIYFAKGGSSLAIFAQNQNKNKDAALKKHDEYTPKKEIIIYMQFINDVLEIDGLKCIEQGDVEKAIKKLQKKYKQKEVTVKYLQHLNDPFIAAKKAEKSLKNNNFGFVISSK